MSPPTIPVRFRSLNPTINGSINPQINRSVSGLYVWNRDNGQSGIMVLANREFFVWFVGSDWRGFAASNGAGGFNVFSAKGAWIGYLCRNSQGDYNLFDVEGAWIGYTS